MIWEKTVSVEIQWMTSSLNMADWNLQQQIRNGSLHFSTVRFVNCSIWLYKFWDLQKKSICKWTSIIMLYTDCNILVTPCDIETSVLATYFSYCLALGLSYSVLLWLEAVLIFQYLVSAMTSPMSDFARVNHCLSPAIAEVLVNTLDLSCLVYSSVLFAGLSACTINRVQLVQNPASRSLTDTRQSKLIQ